MFSKTDSKESSCFKGRISFDEMDLSDFSHPDTKLDLKDSKTFQIVMKYNFTYKCFYKPNIIVKALMKENGTNTPLKDDANKNEINEKKRKPIIIIKIKDEIFHSELYGPKKILKLSQMVYKNFINPSDVDIENINIKYIREILVNLIQYSIELTDLNIPVDFLVNGLYLTTNMAEKSRMTIFENNPESASI